MWSKISFRHYGSQFSLLSSRAPLTVLAGTKPSRTKNKHRSAERREEPAEAEERRRAQWVCGQEGLWWRRLAWAGQARAEGEEAAREVVVIIVVVVGGLVAAGAGARAMIC